MLIKSKVLAMKIFKKIYMDNIANSKIKNHSSLIKLPDQVSLFTNTVKPAQTEHLWD